MLRLLGSGVRPVAAVSVYVLDEVVGTVLAPAPSLPLLLTPDDHPFCGGPPNGARYTYGWMALYPLATLVGAVNSLATVVDCCCCWFWSTFMASPIPKDECDCSKCCECDCGCCCCC